MKEEIAGLVLLLAIVGGFFFLQTFAGTDVPVFVASIGENGKAWSVIKEEYRVWPTAQQVVSRHGNSLERLTKCSVWDAKNWRCQDSGDRSLVMNRGQLSILISESLAHHPLFDAEYQVSRLAWLKVNVLGGTVTAQQGTKIYHQSE